MRWSSASGNAVVTGYGLYRSGAKVAQISASARSYVFAGLTCNVRYSFPIDASDAAGNRSLKRSAVYRTGACMSSVPFKSSK